jgi:outer membrane immunogenic protein
MRKSIGLHAFFVTSALSAQAADLGVGGYSAPPAGQTSAGDFAGLYAGADIGAALGESGNVNTSGYVLGAHVGYTFQAGRLIGGAEVDTLTSNISSGKLQTAAFDQNFLSSARVRAGYVFADLALYGTFGFAYATTAWRDASGLDRSTVRGHAYGFGAEWSPIRNIGLRGELLRYDFGAQSYVTPMGGAVLKSYTHLLRAGVHYRF